MPTFQIPQFIEEKPKIIGPLTLPQFGYLAVAGAISFIAFHLFTTFPWIMITFVVGGAAIALAFVKISDQSAPKLILAAIIHFWKPQKYTWQKPTIAEDKIDTTAIENLLEARRRASFQKKLKSIALGIATGKFLKSQLEKTKKERLQVVKYITGEKKVAKRVDYKD